MARLERSATVHLIILGFLGLLLLIPLAFVDSAVSDRRNTRSEAIRGIAETWGLEQTVSGPYISVPYSYTQRDDKGVTSVYTAEMFFLPETLAVSGDVVPEVRYRGIYQANLYVANLQISGTFAAVDWTGTEITPDSINWDGARLVLGISDPKAIRDAVEVQWDKNALAFGPGKGRNPFISNGVSVPLRNLQGNKSGHSFDLNLRLAGSSSLRFSPYGKETTVKLTSTWQHPSFLGSYLPLERAISENGFTANWKVLYLGRGYPQRFSSLGESASSFGEQDFGVSLISVLDHYILTDRSIKYGILFIFMTFLAFFMFELLSGLRIHPVQYLLVGVAQALFFLNLLAISEHASFVIAYAAGSAGVTLLISGYAMAVVKRTSAAVSIFAGLSLLYTTLYSLLQLEDYALLVGSLGLFFTLAVVMWVTRKVDWYRIELGRADTQG